jgi:hypothetical protein
VHGRDREPRLRGHDGVHGLTDDSGGDLHVDRRDPALEPDEIEGAGQVDGPRDPVRDELVGAQDAVGPDATEDLGVELGQRARHDAPHADLFEEHRGEDRGVPVERDHRHVEVARPDRPEGCLVRGIELDRVGQIGRECRDDHRILVAPEDLVPQPGELAGDHRAEGAEPDDEDLLRHGVSPA